MPVKVYASQKHPDELVVEGLEAAYEEDLDLLVNFWSINGRPAFTRKLTERELLERFADPILRRQIIEETAAAEGPEAAIEYMDTMMRILNRFIRLGKIDG